MRSEKVGWAILGVAALAGAMLVDRQRAWSAPTTQPTTSRPASTQPTTAPAFLALDDSVEGEWAVYSATNGIELRYDILRAGPGIVSVRVTVRRDGRLMGVPAVREELRDLDPLVRQAASHETKRSLRPEKIKVAGKEWHALLYEDRWVDEDQISYVRRTWVNTAVPVYGTLRMELEGDGKLESSLELKSYGATSKSR